MEAKEKLELIKAQMLKTEEVLFSYATKSQEAIRFHEQDDGIRLQFARDVDRIIHSPSYTRYMDKTQVYSDIENDEISRRMTHVQFVSKAAKTIARAIGLNEDLCEAIALGHDVGHVPFGHVGEYILNTISKRRTGKCFAHNLNSVRVFMEVEKRGMGCNLTLQVLDGIMCHNGEFVSEKYTPVKKDSRCFLKEYEQCLVDDSKIKELVPMTLEGCVVRISDIVGYLGKDIDDARKLNFFDIDTIPTSIKNTLGISNDVIMDHIITDIIMQSYGKPYIQMSPSIYEEIKKLKKFNYENIYHKSLSAKRRVQVTDMFEKLYQLYITCIEEEQRENDIYRTFLNTMNPMYLEHTSHDEKVIDYIASMTDGYMERQYEKYCVKK